jgi:hypothetical protein
VLFLVMGLVDYLLCEDEKNVKPTHLFGNTVCHKEIFGVNGSIAKLLLKIRLVVFFIPYARSTFVYELYMH